MGIKEQVKSLISLEGTTMTAVLEKLSEQQGEVVSPNNISAKFKRKTIKYEEVKAILDILGYDIKFEKRCK